MLLVTLGLLLLLITGIGVSTIIVLRYLESQESSVADNNLAKATAAYANLRQAVAQKNALLETIATVADINIIWSETISDLLSAIPSGVKITSMQGDQGDAPFIVFSGQSPTRNSLIVLEKRLQALPWIGSVDAPNSNLIDRVNAPYEFRIPFK